MPDTKEAVVKWWRDQRGYGFLIAPDGEEVFVHHTAIRCTGFRSLKDGQKVTYEEVRTENGLAAKNVKVIE